MSSTDHLSELESLRFQVADLARALAERDRSMQDLREQSQLLRTIIEGTTAETGDEFFASLVIHLTSTLHVQYAVIGEVLEGRLKKIRTLAVSAGGTLADNFEYELAHTPCATALTQTFACFSQDVRARFPQFQRLADLRAESYCAVPLRAKSRAVIGLLVVMDTKPLENIDYLQSLLGVFAPRIAAEFERRQAEQERTQALADLHNVMETVPDVMFTLDTQGNMVRWNRRVRDVTGYSPEELLNKPALAFVPPEEQTSTAAAIQRAFTEGYAELEGHLLTKEHRLIPYHWTGALLTDSHGEPIGIIGVGRDVSDKKRAEEELRQQHRYLVDAQALAHLGSWAWDIDSGKEQWSDEQFRIFGYEPGAIAPTYDTFLASLHPDDCDRVLAAINDALLGKRVYDVEYRIVCPNGEVRFIHARGKVHRDATGHLLSMAGTVLDITERKQVEEALRASEERWQLAVRGSNDGIWDWNIQTGDIFFSLRWKAMRGFEDHEIKNHVDEWRSRIHPDDLDRVLQSIDDYLAKQRPEFCEEYRVQRKDGSYMWVLDRGVALWADDGTPLRMAGSETDITARKGTEEALVRSRDLMKSFVEHTPAAVAMLDRDLRYVAVSGRWLEDYRLGHQQLIGRHHYDVFPEIKDMKEWQEIHQRCLSGAVERCEEDRFIRADGSEDWLRWELRPWHDITGGIGGIIMFTEVITERKRAEGALSESETRFRTMADTAPVLIWMSGPDKLCTYFNQGWLDYTGRTKEQELGNGWAEGVHPDDLDRCVKTYVEAFDRREPIQMEYRLRKADGTYGWVLNRGVPRPLPNSEFAGYIGSCTEITERKHLEQEVQGTNHLLSSILENLPAMVFVKDAKDLRFVHFNPAAETLMGHSKQEMLGKNDYDLFPKAEADFFTTKDREVLENGQLLDVPEEPIQTKEKGLRILHTKKVPILDETGRPHYLLGISEDITARRQAEDALQALTAETASVTGEEFFPVFVRQLAAAIGTRYAFVTELVGDEQARARVLAIWMGDRLGNSFEYDLTHTPCKVVFDQGSAYHPDSVQEIYPNDKDLVALEATAYLGVTLNGSSGRRIGHLCVLDDKPLRNKNTAIALMKVFAARAAAELERKRADAALRASEERYRALYDDTPTMSFTLATDGTVRSVNRFGAEQLGYRVEELIGHSALGVFHEHDKETVAASLSECLATPETTRHWAFRMVRKDGSIIWVRESARVGQSSTGETVVLVTCEDITARKLAEAQQARQYDQLQAIFRMTLTLSHATSLDDIYREAIDCMQQAIKADRASILLFDEAGVMQFKASRGLSERYRASVEDHSPWTRGTINPQPMLVQDAARDASLESYRDILQEEGIAALAFIPLISSAGLLGKFMLYYDQPHHFTNEEIGVAQTIASHVAFMIQRTRANQTLRESKERLQQALDASRAGTWRVDLRTGLDTRDAGLNQLLGLPAETTTQPVGEWFAFIHTDDRPAMDAAWQHASVTGLYEVEHCLVRRDGAIRWVYDRGRFVRDEAGQLLYATGAVIDITERKRMEETLRQRERDLRAAIEERERISQDLHDGILQSLFAIGLTLETTKSMMSQRTRKTSGPPLDQAIDQLNRVMHEIRNFIAGLGSDLFQGENLPTALQHMLALLTQNQATRVRLAVEDRAAKAVSDEQSLHLFLVIQEAVSNCIQHGRAQEAKVSLKMLKQGVRLSIRDNGRGFNPDTAKGTGHGLSNMAARAQKIGGRLTVLSKVNGGTRVVLDLPKEAADVSR